MLKVNPVKIILSMAAILLLIFFHYIGILKPVESILVRATRPVSSGLSWASSFLRIAYHKQAEKNNLAVENEELKKQIDSLTIENANLKNLEDENKVLRDQLKFYSSTNHKYVISDILSRGGFNSSDPNQSLIINKGTKDGLKPGLAVLSGEGVVVGKITAVKDNISEVCLAINPACKLAVTIQGQDKTSGVAEGELGLTIKMDFIPQTKKIDKGNTIITSGLEQSIPSGLVIGSVAEVNKENNELWQDAVIEPLADFNNLTIVSVLIPN